MKNQTLKALVIGVVIGLVVAVISARMNSEVLSQVRAALASQQQAGQLRISMDRMSEKLSGLSANHVTGDEATQVLGGQTAENQRLKAATGSILAEMKLNSQEFEKLTSLYLNSAISILQIMINVPIVIFFVLAATVSIIILKYLEQKQLAIELAKSAEVLRLQNAKLETVMRQRERFIATLAHDMKVPLVGAELVFALMMDETVSIAANERVELLQKLRKSNAEVLSTLQDMIQIYRYENPELCSPDTIVNVTRLLQRCIEWIAPIAKLQGVSIKSDLTTGDVVCKIDVRGIERLMLSLLDNAVKFSSRDSTVSISSILEGDKLQIKITDHGKGISQEDQGRLFTGGSASDAASNAYAGNGLGLYLAKLVVEAHGGSIDCVSELGLGSTFTVHLPLASA